MSLEEETPPSQGPAWVNCYQHAYSPDNYMKKNIQSEHDLSNDKSS
jgi:hypothetical protein